MRVLVVDDNSVTGSALADWLNGHGHSSEWCANGEAALVKLEVYQADAILADYILPGMSGLELARWLLADPKLANIPVIMMTALGGPDFHDLCAKAAVDGVRLILQKPFETEELVRILESLTLVVKGGA